VKLIVGLGNPGPDYDNHKHNIGFWVVDWLVKQNGLKWGDGVFWKEVWVTLAGEDCTLIKSKKTWMNDSGQMVKAVVKEKNIEPKDLIVIHDDLDFALGKVKWDFEAGHGGHNGVRSIIDCLETKRFYRLRLGVGRPPAHEDSADYVLEPFKGEDLEAAEQLTVSAAKSVDDFLKHGLQWVQNHYH